MQGNMNLLPTVISTHGILTPVAQQLYCLMDAILNAAHRAKETMNSEEDADDIFNEVESFYVRGKDGSVHRVKSLANKLFYRIRILFGISGG
jgi:hypothetical protein